MSEVIAEMQKQIEEHGDLECTYSNPMSCGYVEGSSFRIKDDLHKGKVFDIWGD